MSILDEELDLKADVNDFEGLTIAEVTEKLFNNYLDIDVSDTEIDMMVAFVYDPTDSLSDSYFKFLDHLAKHVKVRQIKKDLLICDFSNFYKPFNDKINKWYDDNGGHSEFDGEEGYYDLVLYTEALVSGYATEQTYRELLEILR